MKKITLKKVEMPELESLQEDLIAYVQLQFNQVLPTRGTEKYYDTLLLLDIAQDLCYNLRSKLEKVSRHMVTLHLSVRDAIILLQSCNRDRERNTFQAYTATKFTGLIHKAITDL